MIASSYAHAATGATATSSVVGHGIPSSHHDGPSTFSTSSLSSLLEQIRELSTPVPTSMTLTAALQLLEPLDINQDVFLMTRSYLHNWLIWAYHQKVSKLEASRVEAAVRLAATRLGLTPPRMDMEYTDPGPIDCNLLSLEGHPLLLRPNVEVVDIDSERKKQQEGWMKITESLRRVKSLPTAQPNNEAEEVTNPMEEDLDEKDGHILCSAVPARFYETLRAVHGVICNDGFSVSFQPFPRDSEEILHHHAYPVAKQNGSSSSSSKQRNGDSNHGIGNGSNGSIDDQRPRPIEFRRTVILKPEPALIASWIHDPSSPMTKLMQEEKKRSPTMVPKVEVHPVKISYSVTSSATLDDDATNSTTSISRGFVFVSQRAQLYRVMDALMEVAASKISVRCKRVWSKRVNATQSGDGFELLEYEDTVEEPKKKNGELKVHVEKDPNDKIPIMSLGEWAQTHGDWTHVNGLEVLIETKRSSSEWPRASLELENRIQVGDLVDAQDTTGKWYEALVRDVTEQTVTVHYVGWASKWDVTIPRRRHPAVPNASKTVPPAPLWSHAPRWRENVVEGVIVEVRDASSRVERPKWYKGEVKRVSAETEKLRDMEGGAELEIFEIPGETTKKALVLLNRTQQILVEVEQERANVPAIRSISIDESESMDTMTPQPPFLRWVRLYGEEVCEAGTHMKVLKEKDTPVVTLRYEYDADRQPVEIMKSFNNMYGPGFMKESLHGTPPAPGSVGMHNLGNSCFLNSIVQCLNHIEPLTLFFMKGAYMKDLNRANPLGSGGRVATAYAGLLREMWGGKFSALAPRMLKQTVAMFAPQFNNSYQHDSQEFCQFLMDGLHEDCNRVKSKPYVEELEGFGMEDEIAAIETWRKHLLRHDSVIVDYFQGMHRSHLTCPSCGRESIKFDVFSTISLPLAHGKERSVVNLYDCFDKFMEGEQLDDLNAWYCPNCKKHVCALKMIALWSAPDILILHLKRFTFDHCAKSNQVVRSKVDDRVMFPIDGLDLRKHALGPYDEDAPPIYNLFGVSEHQGATANSGHYTATVRNSKDGRWYRYNDAHVGETTGDAAVTGGAYVLFYKRAKGLSRWAGLETLMTKRSVNPHGGLETDKDGFTPVKPKTPKTPKKKSK